MCKSSSTNETIIDPRYLNEFKRKNCDLKEWQKHDYDHRDGVRKSSDRSKVWIKTGGDSEPGTVIAAADTPSSYIIQTLAG